MFFKPTLDLTGNTDDGSPYELYSDYHKDAFGCRPGIAQSRRYDAMSDEERRVEHATIGAWFAEDDRISQLRTEVARYDFSRRMEYEMRREGVDERGAFYRVIESIDRYFWKDGYHDWEGICYHAHLPYSDAPVLKAKWEELNADHAVATITNF